MLTGHGRKCALVVAPHADDEILGAGGFMTLAAQAGWEVGVWFATVAGYRSAETGRISRREERLDEAKAALERVGAAWFETFAPDADHHLRLDQVAQIELVSSLENQLRRCRPSIVIVPCRGHHHQDHRALADACVTALRPAPDGALPFVPTVLAYGHASAGWGGPHYDFRPTLFLDIGAVIETKLAALACYRSQLRPPPHPRGLEAVRANAAYWGAFAGAAYGEPYECLRHVPALP